MQALERDDNNNNNKKKEQRTRRPSSPPITSKRCAIRSCGYLAPPREPDTDHAAFNASCVAWQHDAR